MEPDLLSPFRGVHFHTQPGAVGGLSLEVGKLILLWSSGKVNA